MKNGSIFFGDDGGLTILGWLALMVTAAFVSAVMALFGGCSSIGDGAKVVEGTDLTFGVQLPYADTETMAVVNYLTGFRVSVAENARCRVKYSSSETNSYFGCITTHVHKTIDAKVEPTVEENEDQDECVDKSTDTTNITQTASQKTAKSN